MFVKLIITVIVIIIYGKDYKYLHLVSVSIPAEKRFLRPLKAKKFVVNIKPIIPDLINNLGSIGFP